MKRIWMVLGLVLTVCVALAVVAELKPLPAPVVTLKVAPSVVIDGSAPPPIPVPGQGSFAIETTRDGVLAGHDSDVARPMASVAKTMTALAILQAHPLAPAASGPTLTVTASDVAVLHQIIADGGTYAPVEAGEVLSERDLLLGLMLPSANNFAVMAAQWIDGGQAAFVSRLNGMAKSMGMSHTVFADPDGLLAQTVSTPSDLLKLGAVAIGNPALAEIVVTQKATLPDGSVITNIDSPLLATPGWLGIKTGHTPAAGYCLLFAAEETLGSGLPPVKVVGAVMGQATRADTFAAASAGVKAALGGYVAVDVSAVHPATSGDVSSAWGISSGLATTASSRVVVVRRGTAMPVSISPVAPSGCDRAGCVVGRLSGQLHREPMVWEVVTTSPIGPPNPWRRLTGFWWLRGN